MGHYLFLYLFNSINKKEKKKYSKNLKKEGSFYSKESKHLEYFDYLSFYNNVCTIVVCLLLREKKKKNVFLL